MGMDDPESNTGSPAPMDAMAYLSSMTDEQIQRALLKHQSAESIWGDTPEEWAQWKELIDILHALMSGKGMDWVREHYPHVSDRLKEPDVD